MQQLIDEDFLRRLPQLRFLSRRRAGTQLGGTHASPRAGMSIEFADYRAYTPGDDLRAVDWNVFARLDRLLVKTFVQEVDVPVYLLVDVSASMRCGSPPKALYAARLALALGYLALRGLDRVGLFPFSERLLDPVAPRHGLAQFGRFLRALSPIDPAGRTSLPASVEQFLGRTRESGIVVILSDFLSVGELAEPLARLRHRGDEVAAIQILDPKEQMPVATGLVEFVDVETDERVTLRVGPAALAEYRRAFENRQHALRHVLARQGVPLFVTPTSRPLEAVLHTDLRSGGILR
ncbi:MAG: DUF58 domain-containing protein [Candidatus Bipolaricaulota bacterium]